jgi:hypothetical protein
VPGSGEEVTGVDRLEARLHPLEKSSEFKSNKLQGGIIIISVGL